MRIASSSIVFGLFFLLQQTPDAAGQTDPRAAKEAWLLNAPSHPQVLGSQPPPQSQSEGTTSDWIALGSGLDAGYGEALALGSQGLYVGGIFFTAGGVSAPYIARWSNDSWTSVGGGTNGWVFAVAVRGNNTYVGGQFSRVGPGGSIAARNIARWDGTQWHACGSGLGDSTSFVLALAFRDTILIAGGNFLNSGGTVVANLAQWDGSSWSTVGGGTGNSVSALAVDGPNLYVGGAFDRAGTIQNSGNIARWDGSAWFTLGTGMNETVTALTIAHGSLYAGGFFRTAGGVTANRIARWDGIAWHSVGGGVNDVVHSIVVTPDTSVYAGGNFDIVYNSPTDSAAYRYIARWKSNRWENLESGPNGPVNAILYENGDLYVTGYFWLIGSQVVNGIAVWREKTLTDYVPGWNLVSMPRRSSTPTRAALFPSASGVYKFQGGVYSAADSLFVGRGYWAYFPLASTAGVTGSSFSYAEVQVPTGNTWVLIGSPTLPTPVSALTSVPSGSFVPLSIFAYAGTGYIRPTQFEPGRGYWLYVTAPCTLRIGTP